jgi:DNA-binding transcriptional LysR family regulator
MDKFVEMRTFTAVVDAGSFVKAAESLAMSKAAVSRYVADLESRLGVRLLHRTTRKLSLTEEGEVFQARCKELLTGIDEAEAEITSHSDEATGHLKVNVPVTFGLLHLAPLWAEFMVLNPKVTLDVTLTDRVVDLVDEGYDLAVRIARLPSSSLISRKLTSTRMLTAPHQHIFASTAHPGIYRTWPATRSSPTACWRWATPGNSMGRTVRWRSRSCRGCIRTAATPAAWPRCSTAASSCSPVSWSGQICCPARWSRCCGSSARSNSTSTRSIRPESMSRPRFGY